MNRSVLLSYMKTTDLSGIANISMHFDENSVAIKNNSRPEM